MLQHFVSGDDHCSDWAESNFSKHSSWVRVLQHFVSGDALCFDKYVVLVKF